MAEAAMKMLAERGLLRTGMEIEPVPKIMPDGVSLAEYRATVLNPNGGPNSVQWRGEVQSLAQMLRVLEREHGASGLYGVQRNFRLVGHEKSLREEAESVNSGQIISEEETDDQPPARPALPVQRHKETSQAKKIAVAAVKAFVVVVATTLGAKFGGWLGGAIAAAVSAALAVAAGSEVKTSDQSE